jgi:hypothetical protein
MSGVVPALLLLRAKHERLPSSSTSIEFPLQEQHNSSDLSLIHWNLVGGALPTALFGMPCQSRRPVMFHFDQGQGSDFDACQPV